MIRFYLTVLSLLCWASMALADVDVAARQKNIDTFINRLVTRDHFQRAELIPIFQSITFRQSVIRHDRAPLEQETWGLYQRLYVTEWRIRKGVEFWNRYKSELNEVERRYGVPANIIVSTIGIETRYGQHSEQVPVIDALATLAFNDNRRAAYFQSELEQLFLLCREQHLNLRKLRGSFTGAIGQPQFMPSSYRHYAVSFDGRSNQIDLTSNVPDIIASVGNFYHQHGWKNGEPVAMPATLTNQEEFKDTAYEPIALKNKNGSEYWMGFHNFKVIKRYNPSNLYAMAVFQLSHYLVVLHDHEKQHA